MKNSGSLSIQPETERNLNTCMRSRVRTRTHGSVRGRHPCFSRVPPTRCFRPGPGCMAEQEAELPTRPCGLSASCSAVRVQTGTCHRNQAAKAAGTGGLYSGGAKIPKGGAGEMEPEGVYHLRSRLSRQGTGSGVKRGGASRPVLSTEFLSTEFLSTEF